MSDVQAQARRAADKAKVAERALGLQTAPPPADPLAPVLHAAHVPMPESLADRLRTLPADALAALALFVTHVWWNGYRARPVRWRR